MFFSEKDKGLIYDAAGDEFNKMGVGVPIVRNSEWFLGPI